jgi:hypothetical protein
MVTGVALETVWFSVTVQVVVVAYGAAIAFGVHESPVTSTERVNATVFVTPYPLAVTVTGEVVVLNLAAFTVNVAELDPAGTLTFAGVVRNAELSVAV